MKKEFIDWGQIVASIILGFMLIGAAWGACDIIEHDYSTLDSVLSMCLTFFLFGIFIYCLSVTMNQYQRRLLWSKKVQ